MSNQRNVFIDCGGHKAETAKWALQKYPDYEIHSFEANPKLFKYYDNPRISLHKKAVWIHNGKLKFFRNEVSVSSSFYIDKNYLKTPKTNHIIVDSIDLSNWIRNNFNRDDYIILKLNIEGAEYPVLYKMIKDGTIKYMNEIYCQFHLTKIPSISESLHFFIKNKILKMNIKFYRWKMAGSEHEPYQKRPSLIDFIKDVKNRKIKIFNNAFLSKLLSYLHN